MEVRVLIFDKFIKSDDFEKNNLLSVTFQGVYNELRSVGFEYALMEFDALNVELIHRIHLEQLDRFFYNQHPNLDFEEMNIIMVEMLTSCLSINEPSLDSKFALNIIQEMKQMN